VTDTLVFNGVADEEMLQMAAAVESRSEHPIAQGIVRAVDDPPSVGDFNSIPGKGAEGRVNGKNVKIVSPGYLREQDIAIPNARYETLSGQGKTVVFVLIDDALAGAIALADVIREESKQAVTAMKEMGLRVMMLTGDNQQVAEWVADEIGLDEVFAEVLPDEKADKVQEVQARGFTTAMVGDGVNDAPALATADVGIAIGAGTDVAVEAADIVLVRNNPQDVTSILKLAQATYRKMVQNLWWAAGYNIVAIPVAAGVLVGWGILFGPAVGAALMSLSTVIVAVNARFLNVERSGDGA
jgi:Cu2+-exporting ATPase